MMWDMLAESWKKIKICLYLLSYIEAMRNKIGQAIRKLVKLLNSIRIEVLPQSEIEKRTKERKD